MNRGILAVSFGTSHADTCKKTIEAIENDIHEKYPQYPFYRAWTSDIIRRKIEKCDGIHIFSVGEALEQMGKDGITEVVVQPTHVLNGLENTLMEEAILAASSHFEKVAIGAPLLASQEDYEKMVQIMEAEWKLEEDEMLVFMGHGSEHFSNTVYMVLNDLFIGKGHTNMIMGTVKSYPTIDDIAAAVKKSGARKVILTPFMIVAGDHASNNLAGDGEDSWKSIFEKEGYEVRCVLKGLGEYKAVRQILLRHLDDVIERLDK